MNKDTAIGKDREIFHGRPPRQSSNRCGNNHIAASGLNQSLTTPNGANMNNVSALAVQNELHMQKAYFSQQQIEVLKNSICKGSNDEEFQVFLMACQKTKLDPFMRQIYAVKRWDSRLRRETMTVQTGIDGYRLIAERTDRYAPGPKPTFEYDNNGNLFSATAFVKKMTSDGTWHVVEAEAFFDEYCQTTIDKVTGEKKNIGMWNNMQRNQLAKCAESLALRKAFPAEMSGVYTKEEMKQAEFVDVTEKSKQFLSAQKLENCEPTLSAQQMQELELILDECEEKYKIWVYSYVKKQYKTDNLSGIPLDMYERVKTAARKNMESNHQRQRQALEQKDSALFVGSVQ